MDYSWPLMKDTISLWDRIRLSKFILTADRFTQGEKVEEFEEAWSTWLGTDFSVFVSSGSTANFLLLAALIEKYNIPKGANVLVPACTWVTNINPIIQLGLTPVFCDINITNFSFDIDTLRKIKDSGVKIDVIFVTHLLGFPARNEMYARIFPDALIIDDVCESHGAIGEDGYKVGANSIGSTFSFYFGHHMSTIEGGMVSTNDPELYDLLKLKRSHGLARVSPNFDSYVAANPEIDSQFLFVTDGYNFRNTEIAAQLGLYQLDRLDDFISIRRDNYARFFSTMWHNENFHEPSYNVDASPFCFPFICKTREIRDRLILLLKQNGVEYRPVVAGNLLRQPYLSRYYEEGKFPNADLVHENGIYIGNNQFVSDYEFEILDRVLEEL